MNKFNAIQILVVLLILFLIPELTQAQIPQEGLIGYYQLDNHAADSSSVQNDGVVVGNVTATEDRNGIANGAMRLSNQGYIELGNIPTYQMLSSISLAAWVRPSNQNGFQAIVSKWAGFGSNGFYLGINPTGNIVRWNLDVPNPLEGTTASSGVWTHVVATYDGDTAKIYQNGILINASAVTANNFNPNNPADVLIGGQGDNAGSTGALIGAIDEVLFYDRALIAEEVAGIFDATTSTEEVNQYVNQIAVFPNPTKGYLNISNQANFSVLPYTMYTVNGSLVKSGVYTGEVLDLNDLSKGMYILNIILDQSLVTKKVVIH